MELIAQSCYWPNWLHFGNSNPKYSVLSAHKIPINLAVNSP